MAHYLIQASYTSGAISDLVKNPQNRADAIRPAIEKAGGRLEAFYHALGDYDVVAIVEMPDNAGAAALSMAISAGGALSSLKTTVLLDMNESVDAMRKAGGLGYRPPGA